MNSWVPIRPPHNNYNPSSSRILLHIMNVVCITNFLWFSIGTSVQFMLTSLQNIYYLTRYEYRLSHKYSYNDIIFKQNDEYGKQKRTFLTFKFFYWPFVVYTKKGYILILSPYQINGDIITQSFRRTTLRSIVTMFL